MGGLSIWHWLIFLVVALLLFGGSGKISSIMGDVAKGIKSFKKGMSEDERRDDAGGGSLQEGGAQGPQHRRCAHTDRPGWAGRCCVGQYRAGQQGGLTAASGRRSPSGSLALRRGAQCAMVRNNGCAGG